ncbi:MAG: hypothetical protein ACR2Q4_15385, partial [Geminicoccaceae bacterium]
KNQTNPRAAEMLSFPEVIGDNDSRKPDLTAALQERGIDVPSCSINPPIFQALGNDLLMRNLYEKSKSYLDYIILFGIP